MSAAPRRSSVFTLTLIPLDFAEWNLPYGVGGGAGSQGQAGTSHRQGPRAGVWTLRQPARPHQAEGRRTRSRISQEFNRCTTVSGSSTVLAVYNFLLLLTSTALYLI